MTNIRKSSLFYKLGTLVDIVLLKERDEGDSLDQINGVEKEYQINNLILEEIIIITGNISNDNEDS